MKTQATLRDFRFGTFELQPQERRLLKAGVAATLGPRAIDVLICLVEQAGHLVSKDALFQRVWPKVVVDDSALQVQISSLRKILGPDAIATVSGRGYRFVLEVAVAAPPCPPRTTPQHNLPPPKSTFVGREREIARLQTALDRSRMLTLTGAGGCGKTRLALQVAAEVLDSYPDGAWLVELASLADPSLLAQAVLSALGVQPPPGVAPMTPMATLTTHLAASHRLLLLDNAEHLLPACAGFADALLRDCPQLKLVVTSREKLGVAGESTYRVPSMSLPNPLEPPSPSVLVETESARLFVDRVRLVRPHFALTEQNARLVATICCRLDGIPLAIELAAGRMREMSVEEVGQRLDQRFSLLSAGPGVAQPRHRTLRALIDWSYDLLSAPEQALLCRMSVFSGGCTLQSAEQVCVDEAADAPQVRDLLAALSEKNLIVVEDNAQATRYRLLETVLSYARERLRERGDAAVWQRRHMAHYLAMADAAFVPLQGGPELKTWLERLEADDDNMRAALTLSFASPETAESGGRASFSLNRFWVIRGRLAEARHWYSLASAAAPHDADIMLSARLRSCEGIIASEQGDHSSAIVHFQQALELRRAIGDPLGVATGLHNLARATGYTGDHAACRAMSEESVAILRSLGDTVRLVFALCHLGKIARLQQDHAFARATLQDALATGRAVYDQQGIGIALGALARVETEQGDYKASRALLLEALTLFREMGDRLEVAQLLEELAHVESRLRPNPGAARLWGAAQQLRVAIGAPIAPNERALHEQRTCEARAALEDDPAFDHAWREGAQESWDTVVKEAVRRGPVDVSHSGADI